MGSQNCRLAPKEGIESYSDTRVLREFESTLHFVSGRYKVALPWKDESWKENLMNSESIVSNRLSKLDTDKELREVY